MYVDPGQTFVAVSYTVTADTDLVAAVAGQKVRVLAFVARSAAGTTSLVSSVTGTVLIGPFTVTAGNGLVLPFSEIGWGDTKVGEALKIDLSATDSNTGVLVYAYVA